jgi:hypothetical protein
LALFVAVVLASTVVATRGEESRRPERPKKLTDRELEQIRDGFEERVNAAFEAERGKPLVRAKKQPPLEPGRGNYVRHYSWSLMDFATRALRFDEQIDQANAALVENARHYLDHPKDINDQDSFHWHADMLCRLIEFYGANGSVAHGRMTPEAESLSMEILWRYATGCVHPKETEFKAGGPWQLYSSDNHHSMDFTAKWHFAKLAKDSPAFRHRRYPDGTTAAAQYAAWNEYLKTYCAERARKGLFVELASSNYNTVGTKGFYAMYDFADDPVLRQRMGYLLDLHWAMWAQEQIDGVRGGGKTRIFQTGSDRAGNNLLRDLAWFYFGIGEPSAPESPLLPALTSTYRPPLVVIDLALDVAGRGRYEILHRPLGLADLRKDSSGDLQPQKNRLRAEGGSIVCYSWCTPGFILGTPMVEPRPWNDWVGMSGQNRWHGAIFAGDVDARIVPQVKAKDVRTTFNAQWSVQRKGSLICQKLRTHKDGKEMRVWFSRPGLTDRREENGWIFVEAPKAYAGVCVVRGGAWQGLDKPTPAFFTPGGYLRDQTQRSARDSDYRPPAGSWFRCRDEWTPVILEVASKEDFAGYEAFRKAVAARPLSFRDDVLHYQGLSGDRFTFYADQSKNPEINGIAVDYTPSVVLDSPFLKSGWNSGVVTITKDGRSRVLDFN